MAAALAGAGNDAAGPGPGHSAGAFAGLCVPRAVRVAG